MKMRWVTKFNLGIKQVLIRQSGTVSNQEQPLAGKRTSLRARTVRSQQKGTGLSGWALSGATRRAEQKWMLFERSEFHPFPDRSKAE